MREAFGKEKRHKSMHPRTAASAHNCNTALGAAVGSVTNWGLQWGAFRKAMLSSFVWNIPFHTQQFSSLIFLKN